MTRNSRIFVAGHRGLVGSAVLRGLRSRGYENLCYRNRALLDLRHLDSVLKYFEKARPEAVVMCASQIREMEEPERSLDDNLAMGANIIEACERFGVARLVYLASSCAYPTKGPRIFGESLLLSDQLRCADSGYGVAKVMCVKLGEAMNELGGDAVVSLVPSCVYGPGDRYRVGPTCWIPALYIQMMLAKQNGDRSVTCLDPVSPWGELLYVDDLASACFLALNVNGGDRVMNVSSRKLYSVETLAEQIACLVGFNGMIKYQSSRKRGRVGRRLDSTRIERLGWRPKVSIEEGLRRTVRDLEDRGKWAAMLGEGWANRQAQNDSVC